LATTTTATRSSTQVCRPAQDRLGPHAGDDALAATGNGVAARRS
jgi:hypothetical protein